MIMFSPVLFQILRYLGRKFKLGKYCKFLNKHPGAYLIFEPQRGDLFKQGTYLNKRGILKDRPFMFNLWYIQYYLKVHPLVDNFCVNVTVLF